MASPAAGLAFGFSPGFSPGLLKSLKLTTIDLVGGIFCHICKLTFGKKKEYDDHYAQHNTESSDIMYTCVACHKEIIGYPSFRGHCYTHHIIKDKFKCNICSKTFSKLTALEEHINAVHKFKCSKPFCDKQFSSKKELHLHEVFHKSEGNSPPYQCQNCAKEIDTIDTCEFHIDKHFSIIYACPICDVTLLKEEAMKHLANHFGDVLTEDSDNIPDSLPDDSSINVIGGILCCYCNNLFNNRGDFETHFEAAHEGNDLFYSCNICNKKYDKYSGFGNHCHYHFSRNRFECDMCWKRFPRLSLLVSHMEAHRTTQGESADEAQFPCPQCNRRFCSERRMRDHLRDNHQTTDLVCPQPGCGLKLVSPKDLLFHRKFHESNLNHWCRQCGLQFPSLASCEKHLDVHKKICFSCPVCSRQYGERYLMMKHIPAHFETVLHVCNVCGKVYTAKSRLMTHLKTHSAAKDFICTVCGKGFKRASHLRQHVNVHSGAKPYACPVCPKTFASYPNWHKHLRKTHRLDPRTLSRQNLNLPDDAASQVSPKNELDSIAATPDTTVNTPGESDESTLGTSSIHGNDLVEPIPHFDADMVFAGSDYDLQELDNAVLPDEIAAYVPEMGEAPAAQPDMPREYGPDFVSSGFADGSVIPLDEPLLPHIDPLLTINACPPKYETHLTPFRYDYDQNIVDSIDPSPKWESPVITKFYVF